jgi:hypothetical protein
MGEVYSKKGYQVLEALRRGEISVEEAVARLKEGKS